MIKKSLTIVVCCLAYVYAQAQTAHSLFWRKDSLQVAEIVSEIGNQFNKVGHHGPAVENSHMALRIYFNDSGAIDVYSKPGDGMELLKYLWYPSLEDERAGGSGNDHYIVGKTVGLGGIALWDGVREVKLVATKGRTARAGSTDRGSYAEMIAYGVEYMSESVDVSIRIDVDERSREAEVTTKELNGKKVCFLTGVNCHEGQKIFVGKDYIGVWGFHAGDRSPVSVEVGAGMKFRARDFSCAVKSENLVKIISRPTSEIRTRIVASSTKEQELNTVEKFERYIKK